MKRRHYILISLFVLSAVGAYGLFYINKHHYIIWNANTLEVKTDQQLSAAKVKILFGISVNTINRPDDDFAFKNMGKYLTLFDGKPVNKVENEYGENDFLVVYDNKFYLTFRHFKFNSRAQHDYEFTFTKEKNTVFLEVDIKGKDHMNFKHKMISISEASQHLTNVPIDSAGTVFNGVELNKK